MKYLAIAALLIEFASAAVVPETIKSSPVPAGATLNVTFEKPSYFIGENVTVQCTLTNQGEEPLSASLNYYNSTVSATDATGREVEPMPQTRTFSGVVLPPKILHPGQSVAFSRPVSHYCRIVEPGKYVIRVEQYLSVPKSRVPVRIFGEATIAFIMPSAAEAEGIVAKITALAPQEVSRPIPDDFISLRIPAYLPALMRRVRTGDCLVLNGIASIATPEATAELITLAGESTGDLALRAANELVWRLPIRGYARARTNSIRDLYGENLNRFIARAWDNRLTPDVHRLAQKWLEQDDPRFVGLAGILLAAVGTTDDAPSVIQALVRQIARPVHLRNPELRDTGLPEPFFQLLEFMAVIHKQGYTLDENSLQGDGQVLAYFSALGKSDAPHSRTPVWRRLLETYAQHPSSILRAVAIRSIPYPASADFTALLNTAASDPDTEVRQCALSRGGLQWHKKPL